MRSKKIVTVLSLALFFVINVSAQRDFKELENAKVVINEKCGSSAEVVRTFSKGKGARIYLLLGEKHFTEAYLKNFFACASRAYKKFIALDIWALSERKQLDIKINEFLNPPPDANPPVHILPQEPPPDYYRHAYYSRFRKEFFEYTPEPRSWRTATYVFRKPSAPLVK